MASVDIKQLHKVYGRSEVLHGVDITIADGEFVILVGPSGCGKSTLLRMIAGLESISGGELLIGDTLVNDLAPKYRDIAMVFQNYALYPHMTVAENMGFSLKLGKFSKGDISSRVDEAAQILGLEHLLDRYPRHLSGGQRQRVAMGRAIVRQPKVFLFDEPLSNLDAKLRVQMRSEIKQLHQRLQTTTVYVTHDQMEAMTMANRIVVMREGYIEQQGAPLELYDHPDNTFVASFIGSPGMNQLRGHINADNPQEFIAEGGARLPLPGGRGGYEGREMIYGIRPEHMSVASSGVSMEVLTVEPTGADMHLTGCIGDDQLTVVLHERLDVVPGDTLTLAPDLQRIHLFDGQSERRVPD